MKHPILTVLALFSLTATTPAFAANNAHEHGHETHSATLQLNAGKKWKPTPRCARPWARSVSR